MTLETSSYWNGAHKKYAEADWVGKPTLFAGQVIRYLPPDGKVLELGGGQGQDARFFAKHGYEVTLTDFSEEALSMAARRIEPEIRAKISLQKMDISEVLPYPDNSFDIVYSHLAIHYFDETTTQRIFDEIYRVLKPKGMTAILVNSVNDPEYNKEDEIEKELVMKDAIQKRFFSLDSMQGFAFHFEKLLLDSQGETYKDRIIGTSNLIRFIGRKP